LIFVNCLDIDGGGFEANDIFDGWL
jgi:hypothetical protein